MKICGRMCIFRTKIWHEDENSDIWTWDAGGFLPVFYKDVTKFEGKRRGSEVL